MDGLFQVLADIKWTEFDLIVGYLVYAGWTGHILICGFVACFFDVTHGKQNGAATVTEIVGSFAVEINVGASKRHNQV